uniref:C2 domain-containing protein n=1 Tax=Sphaeramia orbicularis TaxID=375764 RepID=A0A673C8Q3_9TELE
TSLPDQKWLPTHVQVTVLRGRGLRGKAGEKYSTCVAEKTTEPEWREECSFEMHNELVLTVMHRALIGLDVFLGQAVIPLDKLFHDSRCVKNE